MNTIDDLKSTLAEDATHVDAAPYAARAAGVEGKIRMIRRQRRAGVAAGVAALAAIVGFGVLPALSDDPRSPSDRQLQVAGHVVPEEIEILDFPFRFATSAESEPGDDELVLELDGSSGRRAVAVAVDDLPTGATATLRADGELVARVVGPSRLDDPLPIGTDVVTLALTVSGGSDDTRVGLATYERTDDLAPGLTDPESTTVFRDRVADKQRVGGVFAQPGSGAATFTVTGELSGLDVARHCDGNGARAFYVMSIDDDVFQSGRCRDIDDEDPAAGGYASSGETSSGRHEIRIWTTDRPYGEQVVTYPGVVLGAAAYRATDGTVVGGTDVARVIEWDGRLWELADAVGRSHRLEADGPRVIALVPGAEGAWLQISADGGPARTGAGIQGGAGGYALMDLVWPGSSYDLALVDVDDRPADGAILVYRPVD